MGQYGTSIPATSSPSSVSAHTCARCPVMRHATHCTVAIFTGSSLHIKSFLTAALNVLVLGSVWRNNASIPTAWVSIALTTPAQKRYVRRASHQERKERQRTVNAAMMLATKLSSDVHAVLICSAQ